MAKRLAIQIFGHLRTFEHTYQSLFDNIINVNTEAGFEIDIFIHTWDELQHRTITWYEQDSTSIKVDESYKQKIIQYYSPKSLLIETQEIPEEDEIIYSKYNKIAKVSLSGAKYSFYTQYKVNELRKEYEEKNNIEYDYVLVTRFDILFLNPLMLENYIQQYEFLGGNKNNCRFCAGSIGITADTVCIKYALGTDLIFFGTAKSIDDTLDFYNYIENNPNFLNENFLALESFISIYNRMKNIEVVLICYTTSYDFTILRLHEISYKGYEIKKSNNKIIFKLLFFKITILEKDADKIAWWIPVRKWRDKFRAKFN